MLARFILLAAKQLLVEVQWQLAKEQLKYVVSFFWKENKEKHREKISIISFYDSGFTIGAFFV